MVKTSAANTCFACGVSIPAGDNVCEECFLLPAWQAMPCPTCGGVRPDSTAYCSPECLAKAHPNRVRQHNCLWCGNEFLGIAQSKYCSARCRVAGNRAGIKAQRDAGIVTPAFLRLRFKILERDGYRCRYCGRAAHEARLEIDHVHPRAHGGPMWDIDNLITACWECNHGKGDIILAQRPPLPPVTT